MLIFASWFLISSVLLLLLLITWKCICGTDCAPQFENQWWKGSGRSKRSVRWTAAEGVRIRTSTHTPCYAALFKQTTRRTITRRPQRTFPWRTWLWKPSQDCITTSSVTTEHRGRMPTTSTSYFGCSWFKSRSENRLSSLSSFAILFSPSSSKTASNSLITLAIDAT